MGSNEEDINALKKRIAELEKEKEMVIVRNMYMEQFLKENNKNIVWTHFPPPPPPPASSLVNVPSSGSGSHSNGTESLENCNSNERLQSLNQSQTPQDFRRIRRKRCN
ncbi:uncharacterized protein LOC123269242 [Cotesia glomerata]|uniref:uncharacterized protein LOC123269242 n=1 Tax=Cotesia glomerata TaxID=32391 RepID=UPI001D0130D2|nr:uncharacterized protein LOC123269242 [Cotesia glomerata]